MLVDHVPVGQETPLKLFLLYLTQEHPGWTPSSSRPLRRVWLHAFIVVEQCESTCFVIQIHVSGVGWHHVTWPALPAGVKLQHGHRCTAPLHPLHARRRLQHPNLPLAEVLGRLVHRPHRGQRRAGGQRGFVEWRQQNCLQINEGPSSWWWTSAGSDTLTSTGGHPDRHQEGDNIDTHSVCSEDWGLVDYRGHYRGLGHHFGGSEGGWADRWGGSSLPLSSLIYKGRHVTFKADEDRQMLPETDKSALSTSILFVLLKYCRQVVFPLAMFPSTQIWQHKGSC